METEERLSALEAKLREYDRLIEKLKVFAKLSPTGRLLLKAIGLS